MSRKIAWWKGENDALDSSSYANNGTWVGTPAYTTGVIGDAFSFNGTPYILIDYDSDLDFTSASNFTIDFYFKATNISNTQFLVGNESLIDTPSKGVGIYLTADKIRISSSGTASDSSAVGMAINTWYHVVVKYTAGVFTVKVDDVLVLTVAKSIVATLDKKWHLGSAYWQTGTTSYFRLTGALDEVTIYNDSLEAPMVPTFQKLNLLLAKQQSALGTKAPAPLTITDQSAVDDTFELMYKKDQAEQSLAQGIFGQPQTVGGMSQVDCKVVLPIIPTGSATVPNVGKFLNSCGMTYALSTKKHSWTPSSAVGTDWHDMSLNGYTGDKTTGDSVLTKAHSVMFDLEVAGEVGKEVTCTFTGKGVPDGVPAAATYLSDQLTAISTQVPAMLKNATQTINGLSLHILKINFKLGNDVQLVKSLGDDSGNGQAMIVGRKSSLTTTVYMEDASVTSHATTGINALMTAGTLGTTTIEFGNAADSLVSIVSGSNKSQIVDCKPSVDQGLMCWDITINFVDNDVTFSIND